MLHVFCLNVTGDLNIRRAFAEIAGADGNIPRRKTLLQFCDGI